ncbi:MAG: endonuclease/exonuclease/phosphatase family protein [Flavobacteriaceae bacterium]
MLSSIKQEKGIFTIGFYNVENLFDTENDPSTDDHDFTAQGKYEWGYKKYYEKIKNLSTVISKLGNEYSKHRPAIVGLVEVENSKVLEDLTSAINSENTHYGFVHYDSPDDRGIDVALLYNRSHFELLTSETYPLYLEKENGTRDYTRDILVVKGYLNGELIHIIVNHWPSRREGTERSEPKRIEAAKLASFIVEEIQSNNFDPKIIIMGDFNDNPKDKSVKEHLMTENLYNPMESLLDKNSSGTLTFNKKWLLFDQIIFTKNFMAKEKGKHSFMHAEIYNKDWLKVSRGKLEGSPFRTYIGPWYQGGFSDHFPVYAYFKKEV